MLEPRKRITKKDKLDVYPIKTCEKCGALIPNQSKQCPECLYIFPVSEKEKVKVRLKMMSYYEIKAKMSDKATTVAEKEQLREVNGYKLGWVLRSFTTVQEFQEYADLKGYKKGWVKRQLEFYEKNLL